MASDKSDKKSHWSLLASQLGAQTPQEEETSGEAPEEARGRVAPTAQPSAVSFRESKVKVSPTRHSPGDWGQLAEQLGVEVPQAPQREEHAEPGAAADSARTGPAGESPAAPMPASPEISDDAQADQAPWPTEAEDRVEPEAEPVAEKLEEPSEQAEHEDEKSSRRRRKRRRRPPRDEEAAEHEDPAEHAESDRLRTEPAEPIAASSAFGEGIDLLDEPAEDEDQKGDEQGGGDDDSAAGRGKRRRRRRTSRKKGGGRAEGEGDEAAVAESEAIAGEKHEAAVSKTDEEAEVGGREAAGPKRGGSQAGKGNRPSHRGIPSWEEAAGIIISNNLSTRAKQPGKGSNSHGRGRGRRGRDRSSDKSQ